jgi:hypothetical protein
VSTYSLLKHSLSLSLPLNESNDQLLYFYFHFKAQTDDLLNKNQSSFISFIHFKVDSTISTT